MLQEKGFLYSELYAWIEKCKREGKIKRTQRNKWFDNSSQHSKEKGPSKLSMLPNNSLHNGENSTNLFLRIDEITNASICKSLSIIA